MIFIKLLEVRLFLGSWMLIFKEVKKVLLHLPYGESLGRMTCQIGCIKVIFTLSHLDRLGLGHSSSNLSG